MNCEETESVNDEIQSQEFFDKEIHLIKKMRGASPAFF